MPRAWKVMLDWLTMLHENKDHEEQVTFEGDVNVDSDGFREEEK
jgi:hypothetical protein